jgi:hypothetical protein
MALPADDRVYTLRSAYLISKGTSVMVHKLREQAKTLLLTPKIGAKGGLLAKFMTQMTEVSSLLNKKKKTTQLPANSKGPS